MPLTDGDIEVLSIATRTVKLPGGKLGEAKEIRFSVRQGEPEVLYIPLEQFSKEYAEQMLLRAAADIVDLFDRFPAKE